VRRGWKPWQGVVGTIRSWKLAPAAPHRGAPGLSPRGTWNKAAPRNGRGAPAGALWWERAVRPPHPRCSHPRCRGRRYRGLRRGAARPDAGCRSAPCSRESLQLQQQDLFSSGSGSLRREQLPGLRDGGVHQPYRVPPSVRAPLQGGGQLRLQVLPIQAGPCGRRWHLLRQHPDGCG